MNKIFTLLLCLCFTGNLFSQFEDIRVQLFYEDDGTIAGYPEGYSTYRIYAQLADPEDRFVSVIAVNSCSDLYLRCNDDIWNHELGSHDGGLLISQFFSTDPSLEYDSYLTVGRSSNADAGSTTFLSLFPANAFNPSFDTAPLGVDLEINDGFWGVMESSSANSHPLGENNEVLIAQITTSNELSWKLNVQVGDDSWENSDLYYQEVTSNTCQGQETEWILDTDSNLVGPNSVAVEEQAELGVELFPNPAQDKLQVNISNDATYNIRILDAQGKLVEDLGWKRGLVNHSIDALQSGVYLIQIQDRSGMGTVKKLVVE